MIQTLNDIIHKYTVRATSAQYQEKKLEFGFHKKQQEIMSGLNDIEGLPYIIIQSGLPRLNINKKNWNCVSRRASPQAAAVRKKEFLIDYSGIE